MISSPEVSVIMSVYNGETHLEECLKSICKQTFSNFEFIIVDDASTDRTADILKRWQRQDQRIRLLHNTENKERAISRNRAIMAARAPLIAVRMPTIMPCRQGWHCKPLFCEGTPKYIFWAVACSYTTPGNTYNIREPTMPFEQPYSLIAVFFIRRLCCANLFLLKQINGIILPFLPQRIMASGLIY